MGKISGISGEVKPTIEKVGKKVVRVEKGGVHRNQQENKGKKNMDHCRPPGSEKCALLCPMLFSLVFCIDNLRRRQHEARRQQKEKEENKQQEKRAKKKQDIKKLSR